MRKLSPFLHPSQLLEHTYPGLLNSEFSGQLVEIYVPFPFEYGEEEMEDILCNEAAEKAGSVGFTVGEGEGEGDGDRGRGGEGGGDGKGEGEGESMKKELGEVDLEEGEREKDRKQGGEGDGGREGEDVGKDGLRVGEEDSVFAEDITPLQVYTVCVHTEQLTQAETANSSLKRLTASCLQQNLITATWGVS